MGIPDNMDIIDTYKRHLKEDEGTIRNLIKSKAECQVNQI